MAQDRRGGDGDLCARARVCGVEAVAPKECRLKPRAKNTALTELKLFGVALQHGVKLGLLLANPIYRLGIRRDAPKEKAAITPDGAAAHRGGAGE